MFDSGFYKENYKGLERVQSRITNEIRFMKKMSVMHSSLNEHTHWVSFNELDTMPDSRTPQVGVGTKPSYSIILFIKVSISGWHIDFNFHANSDQMAALKSKLTKHYHDWLALFVADGEAAVHTCLHSHYYKWTLIF